MSNIFNLFGNKPAPSDADGKKPYKAFTCFHPDSREALGFVIYHHDAKTIEVLYYRYLIRVASISPGELVLFFTDSVYTIKGNDLLPLLIPLRDYKINSLQAFNPQTHPLLAADNNEIVIYSIQGQGNDEWWQEREKLTVAQKIETENSSDT